MNNLKTIEELVAKYSCLKQVIIRFNANETVKCKLYSITFRFIYYYKGNPKTPYSLTQNFTGNDSEELINEVDAHLTRFETDDVFLG